MREMGHTAVLDPFTTSAEAGYPVGANAKSLPPLPTMVPMWGVVTHNDGVTFSVEWDLLCRNRTDTYDLATERARYAEFCAKVSKCWESF
jgi:hypothetical protein